MMKKSTLQQLNQSRLSQGLSDFSNTRNAAAGSLKLLDPSEVAKRHLAIMVYDQLAGEMHSLDDFDLPSFQIPEKWRIASTIQQVINACLDPELKNFLESQDFDFDGIVIKVDGKEHPTPQKSGFSLFESVHSSIEPSIREIL